MHTFCIMLGPLHHTCSITGCCNHDLIWLIILSAFPEKIFECLVRFAFKADFFEHFNAFYSTRVFVVHCIPGVSVTDVPIIIADVSSESSLLEMCQQAAIIINCVGPVS